MSFNRYIFIILFFFYGCDQSTKNNFLKDNIKIENRYQNSGFALIYDDSSTKTKALEPRSLDIYHKTLKKKSMIKITNPKNGKSLIANVKSNKVKFSEFYNSIISDRIVEDLELDREDPFIKIVLISKNSMFVAKKTKTFDEEKNVAEKAPIDGIQINDLNVVKKQKKKILKKKKFSYSIKIADFYYKDTAKMMLMRIKNETLIKNCRIIKLSETKYRVLIGPFNDIKSIKKSFEMIKSLNFENLEIIKNV
tara:strand:+ start:770 stop:1522 length:753 start_codon:yes stop_codon:yes gene_type:complete